MMLFLIATHPAPQFCLRRMRGPVSCALWALPLAGTLLVIALGYFLAYLASGTRRV